MAKKYKRGKNVTEQEFNRVRAYFSLPDIRPIDAMRAYNRNIDTILRIRDSEDWSDYQVKLSEMRLRRLSKGTKQANGETPQPVKTTDPIINELAQIKEVLVSIDGTLKSGTKFRLR